MLKSIKILKDGIQLGDIGSAIQKHVEAEGFSVVRDFFVVMEQENIFINLQIFCIMENQKQVIC